MSSPLPPIIRDNVRYQPPFNDVLDEVDQLKVRCEELENENIRIHKFLESLDERINILMSESS